MFTYIVGVINCAGCEDAGVENELLAAFHRLARYPGVDEKDLDTLSMWKELPSIPDIPEESSRFDDGICGGNEDVVLSVTISGSHFASSTRSIAC